MTNIVDIRPQIWEVRRQEKARMYAEILKLCAHLFPKRLDTPIGGC